MNYNEATPMAWDINLARRMREAGMTFTQIGTVFSLTAGTVHCRLDPAYREHRRRQVYERRGSQASMAAYINVASRVANSELEERLAEIPEDNRGFTARTFGDPVFARSAAAQAKEQQQIANKITLPRVSILGDRP